KPNTWVWLLDDDSRLKTLVDTEQAGSQEVMRPDFGELHRLKSRVVDVVLGPCTGAAPLPFLCTLRTQMLDLLFALQTLDHLSPDDLFPVRSLENREKRKASRDYNYDLSRTDYRHLESPVWYANDAHETCRAICHQLAGEVQRILAGEEVFRPMLLDRSDLAPGEFTDSIRRGGSAMIFNPENLLEIPNFVARLDGEFTRRSDMLWAVLGSRHLGWKVVESASIARLQDRSQTKLNGADFDKLEQDIWGNALY